MPEKNLTFERYKPLELSRESWFDLIAFEPDTVIIGIDPGVTTGVSVIAFKDSITSPDEVKKWGSTQISYGGSGNVSDVVKEDNVEQYIANRVARLALALRDIPLPHPRVVIAIEDFIVRKMNQSRDFLAPVRITSGILQAIYEAPGLHNIEYVIQTPADAKGICKDERLDLWGYPVKTTKDRHSRDADRHSVLCLRRLLEKPRSFSDLQR